MSVLQYYSSSVLKFGYFKIAKNASKCTTKIIYILSMFCQAHLSGVNSHLDDNQYVTC